MIAIYICWVIIGIYLIWHIYQGLCLWGCIKYKYRVALLANGIYQSQYLDLFGWKPIWYYESDHTEEPDAQAAIALEIERYRQKKKDRIEKRKTHKVKEVIPFMTDKKYIAWKNKNVNQ